ncbi:hypothetical protein [Paenibacillus camelliae]|uniref:hypothetical protein n=1 Tax=Paenibacillus camelliae TaxID=512410 RepID=UPI00203FEADC|nr:hypothetical protein [Paenibacillus camelliae]MCM3633778.1 hypothetical protein [Paenibacillus camelliae]
MREIALLGFDDEAISGSLFGVEYEVQPKTTLLTYQERTLRYSFSSKTPAELTISKATLLTKEGSSVEKVSGALNMENKRRNLSTV